MERSGTAAHSRDTAADDRRGPASRTSLLAAAGGCVFAAFWTTGAFQISIPWVISLPVHGFAMVALAVGVIALQKDQMRGRAEPPWTWIPAVGVALSVFVSFEVFLIGTILFAWLAIRVGRLATTGAILLMAGAVVFLLGYFLHGPFWSENNPEPSTPLAIVFTAGLALMAGGWVVLATRGRADPLAFRAHRR